MSVLALLNSGRVGVSLPRPALVVDFALRSGAGGASARANRQRGPVAARDVPLGPPPPGLRQARVGDVNAPSASASHDQRGAVRSSLMRAFLRGTAAK